MAERWRGLNWKRLKSRVMSSVRKERCGSYILMSQPDGWEMLRARGAMQPSSSSVIIQTLIGPTPARYFPCIEHSTLIIQLWRINSTPLSLSYGEEMAGYACARKSELFPSALLPLPLIRSMLIHSHRRTSSHVSQGNTNTVVGRGGRLGND